MIHNGKKKGKGMPKGKDPLLMPGGKKSGMDPHAMKDKWEKKQMDMLKPPMKKKNLGKDFKGAYGGK